MSEWQDILTAPKDGTPIIVWVEHVPERGHDPCYSHATEAKWIDLNGGGWTWQGLAGRITHWQPKRMQTVDDLPPPQTEE